MKYAVPYRSVWPAMTIWSVFTVAILWFGAAWTYQNHLFADDAQHVQGTVLRKFMMEWQRKNGTTSASRHYLIYGYEAGNLLGNCQTIVSGDTWSKFSEGGLIPVKYLPGEPQNSRIDDASEDFYASLQAWAVIGLGLVILVIGAVHFAYRINRNKLHWRLLATGASCLGTVTSIEVESGGRDTVRPYLVLEFADEQGQVVQGRTWAMTEHQQWFWDIGKAVQVFYDPAHSDVFTVELDPALSKHLGEGQPPADPFQE